MTENWICQACHGQNAPDAEICACGEGARDEREFPIRPVRAEYERPLFAPLFLFALGVIAVLGLAYLIAGGK